MQRLKETDAKSFLNLGNRPLFTDDQEAAHKEAPIRLVLESLTAVVDNFLLPREHTLHLLDELMYMVERQRAEVSVVAFVEIYVVNINNFGRGRLNWLMLLSAEVEFSCTNRIGD